MVLATSADVVAALGRSLTATETTAVTNVLEQASDVVVGHLGYWPDPVPGPVARVTATMVAAYFEKPTVTTADYDATGYATSREAASVNVGVESRTSSGPWLTNALKIRLRPFTRSVRSVGLVSEQ